MNRELVNKAADNIRILSAAMVEKAKSGHPGGAMGGADFINILYSEFLNFDPDDMNWRNRDRFFLDPGHMSPMLYSILCMFGSISLDDLKNFRQWGSPTPGHPELDPERGIENTSGPLGQGHTMAIGAAIAEKFLVQRFGEWMSHKIYAYISDGGIQEEISQGAGRIAGFLGLNNLIMFYDSNDIQLSTPTSAVTIENTAAKYEAWGWKVITIDGNDQDEIRGALIKANEPIDKPVLIIGKTLMGKGAKKEDGTSFENNCEIHGMPISAAGGSFEQTIKSLGGDPDNPFIINNEVQDFIAEVVKKKRELVKKQKEIEKEWAAANPEKAELLEKYFSGKSPSIDFENIAQKENTATRAASSTLLGVFAEKIGNMIVASADLSNSDKTDGFLKKTHAFKKGDFSGSFLQAGVCELTMASIANGMALHGGVIPVCGTFFVFSDYMKPAVRIAALMKLPVKYVWTHDAFRVGEDGPTHQPVEQEAQIRLLEELKNHSGKPSVRVLRPADATETTIAWKIALDNTSSPTALLLSRQNIKDLPAKANSTRYQDALNAEKGAYIVVGPDTKPDIVLVGNGSEVSTLVEGAALLEERKKLKVQVVSAISESIFRDQDEEYQNKVIPPDVPKYGLTAGLPSTLRGLTGMNAKIHGLDHFGYSAPYTILDEKFGFTGETVYQEVIEYLNTTP